MGKQSSRIYLAGGDHKEIYFQGHYHDKMYIGSELVWEKRETQITVIWKTLYWGSYRYKYKYYGYGEWYSWYGRINGAPSVISWTDSSKHDGWRGQLAIFRCYEDGMMRGSRYFGEQSYNSYFIQEDKHIGAPPMFEVHYRNDYLVDYFVIRGAPESSSVYLRYYHSQGTAGVINPELGWHVYFKDGLAYRATKNDDYITGTEFGRYEEVIVLLDGNPIAQTLYFGEYYSDMHGSIIRYGEKLCFSMDGIIWKSFYSAATTFRYNEVAYFKNKFMIALPQKRLVVDDSGNEYGLPSWCDSIYAMFAKDGYLYFSCTNKMLYKTRDFLKYDSLYADRVIFGATGNRFYAMSSNLYGTIYETQFENKTVADYADINF